VTNNNRHVVLAYGALWVLTAGFLALMFLRQRTLNAEIERLEAEVKKAVAS
jgi:CcmD family protein